MLQRVACRHGLALTRLFAAPRSRLRALRCRMAVAGLLTAHLAWHVGRGRVRWVGSVTTCTHLPAAARRRRSSGALPGDHGVALETPACLASPPLDARARSRSAVQYLVVYIVRRVLFRYRSRLLVNQ